MNRRHWKATLWVALCGVVVASAIFIPFWAMASSEQTRLTATLYSDLIRFEADGLASLQVTIYDLASNELWNSGLVNDNFVDWDLINNRGERLANGYYVYFAQGWDFEDRPILNQTGRVVLLPGNQVQLMMVPHVAPAMIEIGIAAKPPDVNSPPSQAPRPWKLSGNAGTDPTTAYLGTNDLVDLVIRTNATEALRINTFGQVGIGTPNPFSPLHVTDMAGTAQFEMSVIEEGHNDWAGLLISGDGDAWSHSILALGDTARPWNTWLLTHKKDPAHSLWFSFVVENEPHRHIMAITPDGQLGLGTTSPAFTFDVVGTGRFTGSLTVGAYTLPATDGANGQVLATNGSASVSWQTIPGGDPGYWAANGDDIYNSNSGNVGIGTASPNEQLEITGNFRLPPTTATTGIIYAGSDPFIHNYGLRNTCVGELAGNFTMTGYENAAVGYKALLKNTTGLRNNAVGYYALTDNTTGRGNAAVGHQALRKNATGSYNTAIGLNALDNNTTGSYNTAVGGHALASNTTGGYSTAIGHCALMSNFTGSWNTAVGPYADVSTSTLTNATAIGYDAVVNASNKVRIGNDSVTVIEGQVDWSYTSDRAAKENFFPVNGGTVLEKLRDVPVASWNYIGQDPVQFRHYGCVSQDFFAAFGEDELGTIGTETTLTGSDVDGILMASVQALYSLLLEKDAEIDELQASNESLQTQMDDVLERLAVLEQEVRD